MKTSKRKSLGVGTVGAVHQDVDRLLVQAAVYREFFAREAGSRVVNSISVLTFSVIRDALREAMFLGVARTLHDDAVKGPFKNSRLETIVSSMPDSDSDLGDRLYDLRQKYDVLKAIRNRLYHRDRDPDYAISENLVRRYFSIHLFDVIQDIDDLWRTILNRIGVSMPFREEIDARELIEALEPFGNVDIPRGPRSTRWYSALRQWARGRASFPSADHPHAESDRTRT